jgi:hypothetical protein
MARTYWAPQGSDWEFLGAFPDGHKVRDLKQPQGSGAILDLQDMTAQAAVDALQAETRPAPPRLVGLPSAIAKRLQAKAPVVLPWAQIEGYVK